MAQDFPELTPNAVFNYEVIIDGVEIGFQEVSGLEIANESLEYRAGNHEEHRKVKMAGLWKDSELTFKHGVFTGDDRTFEIYNRIFDKDYYTDKETRFDVQITLMDEHRTPVQVWNVKDCFPTKFTSPTLKGEGNEVAVQSITLNHEGIDLQLG